MANALKALLDIIMPPICPVCSSCLIGSNTLGFCARCHASLDIPEGARCVICDVAFVAEGSGSHACGKCITKPPCFDSARSLAAYDGILAEAIKRFKFSNVAPMSVPLGEAVVVAATRVANIGRDAKVTPVPLHSRRLRERGFNQSLILARIIAKRLGLTLEKQLLKRINYTRPQARLTSKEREANVKGAFIASVDAALIDGRDFILVDDVLTTGATANECARTLKKAGASSVHVVTVARVLVS